MLLFHFSDRYGHKMFIHVIPSHDITLSVSQMIWSFLLKISLSHFFFLWYLNGFLALPINSFVLEVYGFNLRTLFNIEKNTQTSYNHVLMNSKRGITLKIHTFWGYSEHFSILYAFSRWLAAYFKVKADIDRLIAKFTWIEE